MVRMTTIAIAILASVLSSAASAQNSTGMTLDICPNNYNNFPADSPPLTCGCSAEQANADDTIWGANPYMSTSSICRAAVHAGAISTSGGEVTVTPKADVPVFPSITRNSIESASTGGGEGDSWSPPVRAQPRPRRRSSRHPPEQHSTSVRITITISPR